MDASNDAGWDTGTVVRLSGDDAGEATFELCTGDGIAGDDSISGPASCVGKEACITDEATGGFPASELGMQDVCRWAGGIMYSCEGATTVGIGNEAVGAWGVTRWNCESGESPCGGKIEGDRHGEAWAVGDWEFPLGSHFRNSNGVADVALELLMRSLASF
jgi:hypothetical protein